MAVLWPKNWPNTSVLMVVVHPTWRRSPKSSRFARKDGLSSKLSSNGVLQIWNLTISFRSEHFGIDGGSSPDLAKVSQIIEIRKKGRSELETFIKRRLADLEPDDIFPI